METNKGQDSHTYHTRIDQSGRLFLPAGVRESAHIKSGDDMVIIVRPDGLEVKTAEQALREAQKYFMSLAPANRVLSEELMQERREEAARE